jgi:hypothetical protein
METYYQGNSGCPIHGNTVQLSNDVSLPAFGLDDDSMKRIAGEITNDTLIHKGLFDYTRKNLISGIDNVYGNIKYDDPAFGKVQEMKRNLANFAGFKSFHQTHHIRQAKPEQLPAINGKYNVNWMRTEYVHTVRSARGAKNWQRYEADKDLYPYLEYMPSTAAEPRNDHKRLYGVVKPVDDPFWDTWMPPADWGCRCGVRQVRNNADALEPPEDIKLPPKAMRNNPGKTGKIITDQHPMMGRVGENLREKIQKEARYLELNTEKKRLQALKIDNVTLPDNKEALVSTKGIKKTLNDCDINEYAILDNLNYFVKNADYVEPRLPLGNKVNVLYSHFYRLKTKKVIYVLIWETTDHEFIFHSITYQIRGKIINADK